MKSVSMTLAEVAKDLRKIHMRQNFYEDTLVANVAAGRSKLCGALKPSGKSKSAITSLSASIFVLIR